MSLIQITYFKACTPNPDPSLWSHVGSGLGMGGIQIEKSAREGNPRRSKGWIPEKAGDGQRDLLRGRARVWLPAPECRQLSGMKSK